MRKSKIFDDNDDETVLKPALSPEARENQMIAYATNLAEKQLREGTASSQVICHYLKLGSSKERLEKQLLAEQVKVAQAKVEMMETAQNIEKLYADAIDAMRRYSGHGDKNEYKVLQ